MRHSTVPAPNQPAGARSPSRTGPSSDANKDWVTRSMLSASCIAYPTMGTRDLRQIGYLYCCHEVCLHLGVPRAPHQWWGLQARPQHLTS